MSTFIQKEDYEAIIRDNRLDAVISMEDNKLDKAELRAIEFMRSYLSSRFDTEEIFNKTGTDRNPVIVGFCVDISLYYLHRLINPRKIPEHRKEAYDDAKEWLQSVSKGMVNPVGLPVPEEGEKDYILFGSNPKRQNHL